MRIRLIGAARVCVRPGAHQHLEVALLGGIATIDAGEAELREILRVARLARLVVIRELRFRSTVPRSAAQTS